jgi:neurotransmitter:Na+ symporter, NSS family
MSQKNQEWGSRLGVILAVAGSAVGLGNFLRFPGQAADNGGGAFMIPYFCALLFLGIPIGWAEWTMGRYGGKKGLHSAPAILGLFGKGGTARAFGVIGVLIPLVVYFYYVLIESWCLTYAWEYLTTGGVGIDSKAAVPDQVVQSEAHYNWITGSRFDGVVAEGSLHLSVVVWAITFAVNIFFVYRGLSKGIEAFCKWAMPVMAVLACVVLVRVLTLGTPDPAHPDRNVAAGLGFMWNPDYSKLGNFKTWLAAAGQIFFSLSVGFGVIINYASYVKPKDDVVLSGLTASSTNELFEVAFGGLITITAAVVFLGAQAAESTGSSFALGFKTLPVVFAHMPFGAAIGAMFFFMLFLAAITSSLSMLQPTMAYVEEALGVSRKGSTTIVAIVALCGSFFVLWFSRSLVALDTIDFWVGTFLIFVLAAVQIICFSWVFGVDRGLKEAHEGAQMRIPGFMRFVMKYVAPTYLIVVFVGFCTQNLPGYVRGLAGTKDLAAATTETDLRAALTEAADDDREWLVASDLGSGARNTAPFPPPTVALLDQIGGGKPAAIRHGDKDRYFVNQKAIDAATEHEKAEAAKALESLEQGTKAFANRVAKRDERLAAIATLKASAAPTLEVAGDLGKLVDAAAGKVVPAHEARSAKLAMGVVGLVIAGLLAILAVGVRRWRAAGIDIDGDKDS